MACKHCGMGHAADGACAVGRAGPEVSRSTSLVGQWHGPLLFHRRLGEGALGTVYVAEHVATGHTFAVKVLHPHLASRPSVRLRFYTESRELSKLKHRHVARVLDARPGPGHLPCLLMEYADGVSFSRLSMPLTAGEAVVLLDQALAALEAAHDLGVVHGDLTTDNLILTQDARGARQVKVLDFGASNILSASLSEEQRACGMVVGSPSFIAPEQWAGEAVQPRVDVYSLGVVGYLLVTGRLPFGFGRVGDASPVAPHELDASVPPALSEVLLRALAQRPEDRFPNAGAFRAALAMATGRARSQSVVAPDADEPFLDLVEEVDGTVDVDVDVEESPRPLLLTPQMAARANLLSPSPTSIFGQVLPRDGATPLHEAVLAAPVEVAVPGTSAPGGLFVRLGLIGRAPATRVEVSDVTRDGFFAAWAGPLPPLAARLPVELRFGGERVVCEADVVRHVTRDEARLWGVAAGLFLQFSEPEAALRHFMGRVLAGDAAPETKAAPSHLAGQTHSDAVSETKVAPSQFASDSHSSAASGPDAAPLNASNRVLAGDTAPVRSGVPAPDAELARLLARANAVSKDPYTLLSVAPHAGFAEIRRRAVAALTRLDAFRSRALPPSQRRALESLRARVLLAARTLGEPMARAGHDAVHGNLGGLSRCLEAGLSEEAVEPLRQAFLTARPDAEAKARALFTQGHALEAQSALNAAVSRYAEALSMDPLNFPWLRHYQDLRQKTQEVTFALGAQPSGAEA